MNAFDRIYQDMVELRDRLRKIKKKTKRINEFDDGESGVYTDRDWVVHVPGSGYGSLGSRETGNLG